MVREEGVCDYRITLFHIIQQMFLIIELPFSYHTAEKGLPYLLNINIYDRDKGIE